MAVHRPPRVGLSFWDYGPNSVDDVPYERYSRSFYRRVLQETLRQYRYDLRVVELSQEAEYGRADNGAWASLPLNEVEAWSELLLRNEFLSLHLPIAGQDVTDYEDAKHRQWSVSQVSQAIDFGFAMLADVLILHPGTYDEKAGRFWPRADEALSITNCRRVTFQQSLREIMAHMAKGVLVLEKRLETFAKKQKALRRHLVDAFRVLDEATPWSVEAYESQVEIVKAVTTDGVTSDLVRHCRNSELRPRLCLENVEPPNFLVNTPAQMVTWMNLMRETFSDACRAEGVPEDLARPYRPGLALDVGHLSNSQVVLTKGENEAIRHVFEGFDDFERSFVNLPGEYRRDDGRRGAMEPMLNRFIRRHGADVALVYVSGSQILDNCMTTHHPIKPFRRNRFFVVDKEGRPLAKYATNCFAPLEELNLEEVFQVCGPDMVYVVEVFNSPPELIESSLVNVREFLLHLRRQQGYVVDKVMQKVLRERWELDMDRPRRDPVAVAAARRRLGEIEEAVEKSRFYLRPNRQCEALGEPGFKEAGLYVHLDAGEEPHDIFATWNPSTDGVWLKDYVRPPATEA